MSNNKKGPIPPQDQASINKSNTAETKYIADITKPPCVTGQHAEILSLLRKRPTLSLELKLRHAITESGARIHELRDLGFDIATITQELVIFDGREHKRIALYVLGNPEWPRPGFFQENNDLPPAA